jgi:hypothetical protein
VEELIALVTDHAVARAAFAEAVQRRPWKVIILRQKTRVLAAITTPRRRRVTPRQYRAAFAARVRQARTAARYPIDEMALLLGVNVFAKIRFC